MHCVVAFTDNDQIIDKTHWWQAWYAWSTVTVTLLFLLHANWQTMAKSKLVRQESDEADGADGAYIEQLVQDPVEDHPRCTSCGSHSSQPPWKNIVFHYQILGQYIGKLLEVLPSSVK